MRRIITLTLLSLLLGAATAATDAVEQKAARHYRAGEWANAAAMYGLLIDRHPQRTDCYARAITSAAMRDSLRPVAVTEQMMLLHRALRAGVPVDSLIISVGRESIALGHAGIYERFLKAAAESEPWMSRIVDAALLRYYTARRDPQAIERYARAPLRSPHAAMALDGRRRPGPARSRPPRQRRHPPAPRLRQPPHPLPQAPPLRPPGGIGVIGGIRIIGIIRAIGKGPRRPLR